MANVNNLNVKLVDGALDVEDNGGTGANNVRASGAPTTITWHLAGVLAQGTFQPVTPPGVANPGFEWKQPGGPPGAFFGPPTIGTGGNSLSIVDNHLDASSDGSWIYTLRVSYQGRIYCTSTSTGIDATVHDPVIINR